MKKRNIMFQDLLTQSFKRCGNTVDVIDFGFIISITGRNRCSNVLEAGTGSGFLTAHLASYFTEGRVISLEIRRDHFEVAKKNLSQIKLDNIELINQDILTYTTEPNFFDLICLDMNDAEKAVTHLFPYLKDGGWFYVYSPYIDGASRIKNALTSLGCSYCFAFEPTIREIEVKGNATRLRNIIYGHPHYCVFGRK